MVVDALPLNNNAENGTASRNTFPHGSHQFGDLLIVLGGSASGLVTSTVGRAWFSK